MFLTKKDLRKILLMAICYFALGCALIVFSFLLKDIDTEQFGDLLGVVGVGICLLNPIFIYTSIKTKGELELINIGNKLVRKELNPAEFIKYYEFVKSSDDLVINKPSKDVLQILILSYDLLDENEKALEAADEMINISRNKSRAFAELLKASLLFSCDRKDEAEQLFVNAQKQKLGILSIALVDTILKSDRAFAMGDYKTVELYMLKKLEQKFPKPDNLDMISSNYTLGMVYEKLKDNQKAVFHYGYCERFGGQTAFRKNAAERIEKINRENLQAQPEI